MRSRRLAFALLLLLLLAPAATCRAQGPTPSPGLFPFVLPWDDASPGASNVSGLLDRPAGALGPVVVRDGHLYTGSKRLRLVGVNLCFASDFPTHAAAEKVAARMAKFGINAVRFHHMDNQVTPNGIWARDHKTLDPGQLDRLDYLFAQLKKNGIYADVNLHVSYEYGLHRSWEGMPGYYKGVDNFDPSLIRSQQNYALHLLTHVNPYTKTRYADDPAVAIVEINNENALTNEWLGGELDDMPQDYVDTLTRRWNAFLTKKYATEAALKTAWGAKAEQRGAEMLRNGNFARGMEEWNLERIEGAEADARVVTAGGKPVLAITVPRPAKEAWHVQLDQARLSVKGERPYTLSFRARSDRPRRISVNVMQAHEPWRPLWSTEVALTGAFQSFRLICQPDQADPDARVTFTSLGDRAGRFELADVSFRPGGVIGLEPGEALGTIAWVKKRDLGRRTPEAQRDWLRFLSDVETSYWTGMARYLKDDLKVHAPLVGTPMGWSPPAVQAKLDVIDSHSYWQHPHFPGRQWDSENWIVKNLPMAGRPDGGTLPALGLSRLAGKPFICTEYNHSAPNTYASETAPVIFAYAAWQDWDGVFLFAYSHRGGEWDTGAISSFFDIDQHPTKMATLPAAAALFLRGDVPAEPPALAHITPDQFLEALRLRGPWNSTEALGLDHTDALSTPVARVLDTKPSVERHRRSSDQPASWSWRSEHGHGVMSVDTPRSKVLVTGSVPGSFKLGDVTIAPAQNMQNWAVITVTALDGPNLQSPGKVLITATGLAENTGMRWTSEKHESVGRDWGGRPSLVEGIPATVTFTVPGGKVVAWALDERGHRRQAASVMAHDGAATVTLDPALRTIWYEVEIQP